MQSKGILRKRNFGKSHMNMDCLWGELYGSINVAEINDGIITPEHADYLRQEQYEKH